jgi:hypothetical protein
MTPPPAANDTRSEIAILSRVLSNGKSLSPSLARHLLTLGFSEDDQSRMNDLAERNRQVQRSERN